MQVSNLRNVFASWGSFSLAAVGGLFLSPFVVHTLGATAYGVWVIIGSLTGSLGLLDLGVRSAVTRFIARTHAIGAHEEAGRLASTARYLYSIAAANALIVTAVLAFGIAVWFRIPPELEDSARLVLIVTGISFAVVLTTGLYGGILAGVQRLDLIGFSNMGMEALRILLVLVVLYTGGGLIGLGLIGLLLTLMRYEYQRGAAARCYPELVLDRLKPMRADVKSILDVSVFSTLIYSMATVSAEINIYVIGVLMPVSMVTVYAIGGTLPIYAQALSMPIAQVVLPQASRLEATGNEDGMRMLLLDSGRLGALAVLPMVLAFTTRGATFIGIWMGETYRATSGPVLAILSVGAIFGVARHVMQTVFVGSGRHRHLVIWYVIEAVLVAVLSIAFVRRWGLVGAAWAAVIPMVAVSVLVFPAMLRRHFGLPVLRVWTALWIRPLIAMLPYAVLSWYSDREWPTTSYLGFFAQVLALMPVAIGGAMLVGLSSKERRDLTAAVRRQSGVALGLLRSLGTRTGP